MSLDFDSARYRYPSRRAVVFGARGMVVTGHPLAAQAGLEILKKGGNAIDAAVATAACLTVVEPTCNGIGGDCFAIVWTKGRLYGLNSSGPAPRLADAEYLRSAGYDGVPTLGWPSVTVPGAPAGWLEMIYRFGSGVVSTGDILAPAADYAVGGFAVSPTVSALWRKAFEKYSANCARNGGAEFREWFRTFCPLGHAPMPGEICFLPDHAATLKRIAEGEFYCGELAERIDAFSRETGGWLRKEDLAGFRPEWVNLISARYRGFDVWEIPPNGHGIAALMALKLLDGLSLPGEREAGETYHLQIEAMKLAFSDTRAYVADPGFMTCGAEDLLSTSYLDERRKLIGREAALPAPGRPEKGGTVYLAAADGQGNMVSMIQSNYMGFGSGIVVPGTGVALHNRGANFSLDPASPNVLAPGKKPYHTIIPGFLTKDGRPIGPFGVMGAFMQPQGHVQVVTNLVDYAMNPQEALDAQRWQWISGKKILLERAVPEAVALELTKRGHDVEVTDDSTSFGRGEIIVQTPYNSLAGAAEPRTDGCVAAM